MSSDPNANPELARWSCANCEAPFSWSPVVFLGLPFCCSGCAASGPCICTYEDVPERSSAGFGAAGVLPEAGPHPPVPMTADVRGRLAREVEGLSSIVAGRGPRRRARFVAGGGGAGTAAAAAAVDEGLAGRVGRLLVLEDLLARARVPELDGQAVVGSRVKVYDGADRIATYTLVLPDDADPQAGRIAPDSPMGRALLGARAGDAVEVRMSGVGRSHLVVDVRYAATAVGTEQPPSAVAPVPVSAGASARR